MEWNGISDTPGWISGAQLLWTPHWCVLSIANGSARRRAAHTDGVALGAARGRKDATYPELVGRRGGARLVVEVENKWSPETQSFLSQLASVQGPQRVHWCADVSNKRGDFGRAPCCHAQLSGLWQFRCWSGRGLEARMALVRHLMRLERA